MTNSIDEDRAFAVLLRLPPSLKNCVKHDLSGQPYFALGEGKVSLEVMENLVMQVFHLGRKQALEDLQQSYLSREQQVLDVLLEKEIPKSTVYEKVTVEVQPDGTLRIDDYDSDEQLAEYKVEPDERSVKESE